jgi:cytochrome b pre-mRNA-processing protein 3
VAVDMLTLFKRAKQNAAIAQAVYGAIVAQARQPALYVRLGVPDTLEGRFDLVVLHLILALDRLGQAGEAGAGLAQAVFDLFITDMDRAMRESGVGDLSVPRKMKTVAEAFYGRAQAYRGALAAGDRTGLAAAIERNIGAGTAAVPDTDGLAGYALAVRARFGAESDDTLLAGRFNLSGLDALPEVAAK